MSFYRRRLLAAVLVSAWAASAQAVDINVPKGEGAGHGHAGQAGTIKTAPGSNFSTGGQLSLDLRGGISPLQGWGRSAMAEYLAKGMVSEGFETSSRGLSAYPGQAMPGPALEALQGYGIDAQGHQAQGLTRQDIEGADVILGMTGGHVVQILERYPQARGKVHTLNGYAETGGGDIGDPYGSDLATYKETAARLEEALGKILKTAPAPAASASPR